MSKVKSSIFDDMLVNAGMKPSSVQKVISLDKVKFNKDQPRQTVSESELASLAQSIKEHGLLEPILVRPIGELYEVVAGERRTRASILAGETTIPALVKELDNVAAFELAVIENLQREDLNPVDETRAILKLLSLKLDMPESDVIAKLRTYINAVRDYRNTGIPEKPSDDSALRNTGIPNDIANRIDHIFLSLGRFTVHSFYNNRLPILELPEDVRAKVESGELGYTKARLLSKVDDVGQREQLLEEVIDENLSRKELNTRIKATPDTDNLKKRVSEAKSLFTVARLSKLNPKKRKRLDKLLSSISALLDED